MEETEVSAFVKNQVGEYPLYISIDKDVLCETDADTNWSQGDMRLSTMLECLGAVKEKCAERISRILRFWNFLHLQMWVRILRKTKTGQQEETDEK